MNDDRKTYYVRIHQNDEKYFRDHTDCNDLWWKRLSHDFVDGKMTYVYTMNLSSKELLSLKLALPLIGYVTLGAGRFNSKLTA